MVLLLAGCAGWAVVMALRVRRRRYLIANRPRVIGESLKRAKTKQGDHDDLPGRTRPSIPPDG
ncbi:MAG: hypothetical protein ABIS21_04075 [Acidimicrobiales bacterium]